MNDLLDARWWIKRAFRGFVAVICVLAVLELAARTPFGSLLIGGLAIYAAYRVFSSSPQRPKKQQSNTGGAERTPVLPGGHQ